MVGAEDPVIAGAVANDGAELRQHVHHVGTKHLPARGDQGANASELFGAEHVARRLAGGIDQIETLADPDHQGFGKSRIDQDLIGHASPQTDRGTKEKGGTGDKPRPAFESCDHRDDQPITLPGSTFTPGPMVEDTATRWM